MNPSLDPHHQPTAYETWPELVGRLHDLDLSPAPLIEVMEYAYAHYAECTRHDPKVAAGYILWAKGVRGLRDRLVPQGWSAASADNYETVLHKSGLWQIAVAGGDARTGQNGPSPSTRTDKGSATGRAISLNRYSQEQAPFDNGAFPALAMPIRQTWILLLHVDHMNEQVRAELSLPLGLDQDGHVSWWFERILLPPLPYVELVVGATRGDDEDDGDVNIEIARRVR